MRPMVPRAIDRTVEGSLVTDAYSLMNDDQHVVDSNSKKKSLTSRPFASTHRDSTPSESEEFDTTSLLWLSAVRYYSETLTAPYQLYQRWILSIWKKPSGSGRKNEAPFLVVNGVEMLLRYGSWDFCVSILSENRTSRRSLSDAWMSYDESSAPEFSSITGTSLSLQSVSQIGFFSLFFSNWPHIRRNRHVHHGIVHLSLADEGLTNLGEDSS